MDPRISDNRERTIGKRKIHEDGIAMCSLMQPLPLKDGFRPIHHIPPNAPVKMDSDLARRVLFGRSDRRNQLPCFLLAQKMMGV